MDGTGAHGHELTDDDASLARDLVSDLHRPDRRLYWVDMVGSALAGWSAFVLACRATPGSWLMLGACVVAFLALYRALSFLHELSHQTETSLPGFALGWNALVGVPLMFPSVLHVGVHVNHHRIGTYGTDQDPEYYRHGGSIPAAVGFVVLNAFLPVLWSVRFLALAPIGWLHPPFHRMLEERATSLSMSPAYRRRCTNRDRRMIFMTEAATLLFWATMLALAAWGIVRWRAFALWAIVVGTATGLNAVRTLGAHRYCNNGEPLDRLGQLLDSIDTPGGMWTELWAPVGLRYHALHHFFPGLPYHNLGTAHRRLLAGLPEHSPYRAATSRSLLASLRALLFDACRSFQLR